MCRLHKHIQLGCSLFFYPVVTKELGVFILPLKRGAKEQMSISQKNGRLIFGFYKCFLNPWSVLPKEDQRDDDEDAWDDSDTSSSSDEDSGDEGNGETNPPEVTEPVAIETPVAPTPASTPAATPIPVTTPVATTNASSALGHVKFETMGVLEN